MTRDEFLKTPSMPAFAPSYPHGPFRLVRREYLPVIITYETDPNAIRSYMTPILLLGGTNIFAHASQPNGRYEPAPLEEAGLHFGEAQPRLWISLMAAAKKLRGVREQGLITHATYEGRKGSAGTGCSPRH